MMQNFFKKWKIIKSTKSNTYQKQKLKLEFKKFAKKIEQSKKSNTLKIE